MTTRFINSVLFLVALFVTVFSHNSIDPLYLFISGNMVTNIVRLIIFGALLAINLRGYIEDDRARQALKIFGFSMLAFGMLSLWNMNIESALYGFLKPLDFMLVAEVGITAALMALTIPRKAPKSQQSFVDYARPYALKLRGRTS
jgi:hypothetical protein